MAGDPRTYYRNHTVNDTTRAAHGSAGDPAVSIQTLGFSAPEGYIFKEWNTARDGSGTSVTVDEVTFANVLYAIWKVPVPYLTNDGELTSIANAIRIKGGTSAALEYPSEFISAIQAILTGTPKAAQTYYPSTSDRHIAPGYVVTGLQIIKGVLLTNLTAENIKKDVVVKVGDSSDDDRIISVTGTYEGSGGGGATEYVLNSTRHPIGSQLVFDLTSAGLTSADLVLDGKTFFWLETTANATIECWEDNYGDDSYTVTIPSGTKFMCCQINTNFYFAGVTTSTYGFIRFGIDDSISGTEYLLCDAYGDYPSSNGFVNSIGRNVKGCPGTLNMIPLQQGYGYPWELHVVKLS